MGTTQSESVFASLSSESSLSPWIWLPIIFIFLGIALFVSFKSRSQSIQQLTESLWTSSIESARRRLPPWFFRTRIRLGENERNLDLDDDELEELDELPLYADYKPPPNRTQQIISTGRYIISSSSIFINRLNESKILDLFAGKRSRRHEIRFGSNESFSRPYLTRQKSNPTSFTSTNLFDLGEEEGNEDAEEL